jgi:hypothetical protein
MNVAQRHGRFLVDASCTITIQGDGVNKAPSVACGNFAIDTVCGYLTMLEAPGPDRSEEAGDNRTSCNGEYVNGLRTKAEPPIPEHLRVLCWTYEDQELSAD